MASFGVSKWWSESTVAVVTGSNKGIGLEIARILADLGFKTILTSRNAELGEKAVQELHTPNVDCVQLDITNPTSVQSFADALKSRYGKVDVLVNNAGILFNGFGPEEAQKTIDCNVHGTRQVTEAVLPLMTEGGRIVNLCSRAGMPEQLTSPELIEAFTNPQSIDAVTNLADSFVSAVREGNHRQKGWSNSMYGVSKIAEMSYTRWLARELKTKGIAVYGVCPGWVVTDMTSGQGMKTAAEGADTPVWLALQPVGSIAAGELYGERSVVEW